MCVCRHLEEILGLGTVGALRGQVKCHMAAAGLRHINSSNVTARSLTCPCVCVQALGGDSGAGDSGGSAGAGETSHGGGRPLHHAGLHQNVGHLCHTALGPHHGSVPPSLG